jgi:hypothetical protein
VWDSVIHLSAIHLEACAISAKTGVSPSNPSACASARYASIRSGVSLMKSANWLMCSASVISRFGLYSSEYVGMVGSGRGLGLHLLAQNAPWHVRAQVFAPHASQALDFRAHFGGDALSQPAGDGGFLPAQLGGKGGLASDAAASLAQSIRG